MENNSHYLIIGGRSYLTGSPECIEAAAQQQLNQWVIGNSQHNVSDGSCCPDFSCCDGEIETTMQARVEYRAAYLKGNVTKMCAMFTAFLAAHLRSDAIILSSEVTVTCSVPSQ
jgi:hypothetical protein